MLGLGLGVDKIRPVTGGLLDLYPATAAYSLRALSSSTTNVVRVREDGSNTEQDFTAKEITDGTLASFCGANNGFVVTWYDQAGSNNLTNATAIEQPKIYDSSTGVVLVNGKAGIDFSAHTLALPSPIALTNQSIFAAVTLDTNITAASTTQPLWRNDAATVDIFSLGISTASLPNERLSWISVYSGIVRGVGQTVSNINAGSYLWTAIFNTSPDTAIYQNGVSQPLVDCIAGGYTSTVIPAGFQRIGANSTLTSAVDGKYREIIIYNTDQSANRTAIESNINSHYNIYP